MPAVCYISRVDQQQRGRPMKQDLKPVTERELLTCHCLLSREEEGYLLEFHRTAGLKGEDLADFLKRVAVTQAIQQLEAQALEQQQREAQQRMQESVVAKLKRLYEKDKGE